MGIFGGGPQQKNEEEKKTDRHSGEGITRPRLEMYIHAGWGKYTARCM
jgi:hypothetical protein